MEPCNGGQQCVQAEVLLKMSAQLGRVEGKADAIFQETARTNGSVAELFRRSERTTRAITVHGGRLAKIETKQEEDGRASEKRTMTRSKRLWQVLMVMFGAAITTLLGIILGKIDTGTG